MLTDAEERELGKLYAFRASERERIHGLQADIDDIWAALRKADGRIAELEAKKEAK